MNYEKKYKLLREAVMLGARSKDKMLTRSKTDFSRAYWLGQTDAFIFLKGYIEQMLEDEDEQEG
jgi:hypothetical protein